MRALTKLILFLLVLILGFVTCLGTLAGGVFIAYTSITPNDVGLNLGAFFNKDNAEVDIHTKTAEALVADYAELMALGDDFTLNTLVAKYGLVIPEDTGKIITPEVRKLPLQKVFAEGGVDLVLDSIYFGEFFGYEKKENTSTAPGAPKFIWYDPVSGEEVTGLNGLLAEYTLKQFSEGGINTDELSEELFIYELLDMTKNDSLKAYTSDGESLTEVTLDKPITVWYDRNGKPASAVLSAIADCHVNSIESSMNGMTLADVMGYTAIGEEKYAYSVEKNGEGEYILLEKATGPAAELSHLMISEFSGGKLSDELNELELSTLLGYELIDGKWYDGDNAEITGIMACIADLKVGELGAEIGTFTVGEISDLTLVEGKWYSHYDPDDVDSAVPAGGIIGAMADLTVEQLKDEQLLSEKIKTVAVADAIGYENIDGVWYNGTEKVTGFMAVIASEPISDIQTKIDSSLMGDLLGYTEEGGVWYDADDKLHPLMNKVSKTKFDSLSSLTEEGGENEFKLGEIIPDSDTGFMALADPETPLSGIPNEVTRIFNNTTFTQLIANDMIVFEDPADKDSFEAKFGTYTLPELISFLVDNMHYFP